MSFVLNLKKGEQISFALVCPVCSARDFSDEPCVFLHYMRQLAQVDCDFLFHFISPQVSRYF